MKLSGNQLFVSAPDKAAESSVGIVYVYNLTPSSATVVEAIGSSDSAYFGNTFDMEGNKLVILGYHALFQEHMVLTFEATGDNWTEISAFAMIESGAFLLYPEKLRLDSGKLYMGRGMSAPVGTWTGGVSCFEFSGNAWVQSQFVSSILVDNIYSDFDVSGDKMIVGLSYYTLTETRNSPVQYFLNVDGVWTLQDNLYGTAPNDTTDDAFGASVAMSPQLFVIGSPQANTLDPGLAYYVDASLSVRSFGKASEVFPNPTSGIVSWTTDHLVDSYEIFDLRGQRVASGNGASGTADLGTLSSGLYLLKLHAGGTTSVQKIVRD